MPSRSYEERLFAIEFVCFFLEEPILLQARWLNEIHVLRLNCAIKRVEECARTMAVMTIAAWQLFHSLTFRHPLKSLFQTGIFTNQYLTGAVLFGGLLQLLVMGIPVLRNAFRLQMLDAFQLCDRKICILGIRKQKSKS